MSFSTCAPAHMKLCFCTKTRLSGYFSEKRCVFLTSKLVQVRPIRVLLISIIRAVSLVNDGCGILFFAARFVAQSEDSPVPQVINVLEVVAAIRQEFICGHIVVHKGVSPLQVGRLSRPSPRAHFRAHRGAE